jgi:HEAT repeat protein
MLFKNNRKPIIALIFISFSSLMLHGCAAKQIATTTAPVTTGIKVIEYGLFTAEPLSEKPLTTFDIDGAGVHNITAVKLSKKGDKIAASLLGKFGIRYKVLGSPPHTEVELTVKVLPPGANENGPQKPTSSFGSLLNGENGKWPNHPNFDTQWRVLKRIGETTYDGFVFEKDWQLVPGKWAIQIFHEEKLLGEKIFEVFLQDTAKIDRNDFLQIEIARLNNPDCRERLSAALQLEEMGPGAAQATPYLINALKHNSYIGVPGRCDSGVAVTRALASIGPGAVKPLILALAENSPPISEGAKEALRRIGEQAMLPLIEASISDKSLRIRSGTVEILEKIHDSRVVPTLIRTLEKSKDASVRQKSIEILGNLKAPQAAQPLAVIATNKNEESALRCAAIEALAKIGDTETTANTVQTLQDENQAEIRVAAIRFLGLKEPTQPTEVLLQLLGSGDEKERAKSLTTLVEKRDPRALELTLAALNDPDMTVRCNAASLLGETEDPKGYEALLGMTSDQNPYVRQAVVGALAKRHNSQAIPSFLNLVTDTNSEVRIETVQALALFDDAPAHQAIMTAVSDEDSRVREQAIQALAKYNTPETINLLIGVIRGNDSDDSSIAVKSLVKLGEVAVLPLIKSLGRTAEDPGEFRVPIVRRPAMGFSGMLIQTSSMAIGSFDSKGKPIQTEKNPEVRLRGIAALTAIGKPAIGALLNALRDENTLVRQGAIETLGNLREERAVIPLIESLNDPDLSQFSCSALIKIGEPAVEQLLNRSNDPNEYFHRKIMLALANIADKRAADVLLSSIADKDHLTRCISVRGLGNLKEDRAVGPLIKAYGDDPLVRIDVIEALGAIGNQEAICHLLELLANDPNINKTTLFVLAKLKDKLATKQLVTLHHLKRELPKNYQLRLRLATIQALKTSGDIQAVELLIEMINDGDRIVKEKAILALKDITGKDFNDDPSEWKVWFKMARNR